MGLSHKTAIVHLVVSSASSAEMLALTATKPAVAAAPASQRRPRSAAAAPIRAQQLQPEQQAPRRSASSALLDRRTLLTGAAVLAGAALQQALPAAAADEPCEFATAPNGLQWCDVQEGSGDSPAQGAMIRAHYTGRLASNGAVFDSSYDRGRPLQFKIGVGQVIKGWDQGILGGEGVPPMKEGGRRRLRIPSELAYGSRGVGPIPANSDLVFDVELLGRRKMG